MLCKNEIQLRRTALPASCHPCGLLFFPLLCTICSLASMSCYFFRASALLACLFKGKKWACQESRWFGLAGWLTGVALGGLGRGEIEWSKPRLP